MFPEKTKWLKRPVGWKDLGEEEKPQIVHGFCNKNTPLHLGKQKNILFKFCPNCMVIISKEKYE